MGNRISDSEKEKNLLAFLIFLHEYIDPIPSKEIYKLEEFKSLKSYGTYLLAILMKENIIEGSGGHSNRTLRYCSALHPNIHMAKKCLEIHLKNRRGYKQKERAKKQTNKQNFNK